jgi:2-dehydro-3-deoxyphosphogluconate aldolase/(4S)-4-hydroxy-2-oxoglutarate aldolase
MSNVETIPLIRLKYPTEPVMTPIEEIEHHILMVAVRTDTPEKAYRAATACITGGVHLVEITFSVPGADEVIRKLRTETNALIGAGTVLNLTDLKKALKAGASYIVSPHLDEEIVKLTKKEGAVSIPGACTPTEIYRSYRAGGDIIKLFPFVEIGGLNFLKAIRGPMPFVKFMLSGGVTLDNISKYLAVKASCILIGSSILKKESLAADDWDSITELSRKFMQKIGRGSLQD